MIAKLTQGSEGYNLIHLSIPTLFGLLSIFLVQIADTYFLGRLGTVELAAISFTFPVVTLIGHVTFGIGVAASSVISRAIGVGDKHLVQRLTTDSLILSLVIVVFMIVIGFFTIDSLFTAMGADEQTLPRVREYMQVWYVGMFFLAIPMVGTNAIRATGDTKIPSMIMIQSAIVNAIFDPILIFGLWGFPRLEMQGAAIATVISRIISTVLTIAVLYYREKMLTFKRPSVKEVISSWKEILHIALPTSLTVSITPISMGIITSFVAFYGATAVAGFGVATRIEVIFLLFLMALSTSMTPFSGQNWGARLYSRIRKSIYLSSGFCVFWGLLSGVILSLWGEQLALLFDAHEDVVRVTVIYLAIVPITYGFQGIIMVSGSSFNGIGAPLPATAINFIRMGLLYIPLAFIFKEFWGISGVFFSASVSNVLAGILAFYWIDKAIP